MPPEAIREGAGILMICKPGDLPVLAVINPPRKRECQKDRILLKKPSPFGVRLFYI